MDDEQRQHLHDLRTNHLWRLRLLERKSARLGISTPAEMELEIEERCG